MSLPYDPRTAVDHLSLRDPALGAWIATFGAFGLEPRPLVSVFGALLRSIVYQQLSGKAAATIYGRLCALFPDDRPTPGGILDAPEELLRSAGMSRPKIAAAKDLAAKTLDGTVPEVEALHAMDDAAIVEHLTQVRGIGPWTVEMLLIFWMGRPDVLPATDLGVRRGFMHVYDRPEMPAPAELHEHGRRWEPYRSVAAWYLWRAADVTF